MPQTVPQDVLAELAPSGVLRAGINLSNFLLVSGKSATGEPEGVAPDMARAIAERLGVPVAYVTFPRPGELADAAGGNVWDIGLIAAEPARAEAIAFSPAYAEIEATYLVPAGSKITSGRRGRPPGHPDRDRGQGRLRPLAQPPPPERRAGPRRKPGRLLRSFRDRKNSTRSPASARACSRTWKSSPAPASWTASSPPSNRRSAPPRPTPPAPVFSTPSSRTPKPQAWSPA